MDKKTISHGGPPSSSGNETSWRIAPIRGSRSAYHYGRVPNEKATEGARYWTELSHANGMPHHPSACWAADLRANMSSIGIVLLHPSRDTAFPAPERWIESKAMVRGQAMSGVFDPTRPHR